MVKDKLKSIVYRILPCVVLDPLLGSSLVIKLRHYLFFTKAYYCKALSGDSNYNICINSDMTVSCNCWDYDGSGHIGDMNTQTLEQIFHGKIAQSFRRKLARGWLPIKKCASCWELQRTDKRKAGRYLKDYHVPVQGIMVENTALCNFRCTICPRDRIMKTRKRPSMSLGDMEKVAKIISDHGFYSVAFHNLGEPFSSKTVFEEVSIMRKYNPHVRLYTSTNGFFLDSRKKREAALLMDHIFFSIDGPSQELVARYQAGADFERSYRNMKELVNIRDSRNAPAPVVEWKYVVFNWNDGEDAIERAIELAKEARVDIISFWRGIGLPSRGIGSVTVESQRFLHDPYFQRLGVRSWKGREIDLRCASGRKNAVKLQN
jgi:pyruvate-formate lyase-activating enzyme